MAAAFKKRPLESHRIDLRREIVLRFPDFRGFVAEYSTNLSMTGMFVQSRESHPPGTPVSFEFKLVDGMSLIDGKGWVVWVRESEEDPDQPPGMGIEFTELSSESRRLIRWMVLDRLGQTDKPFELRSGAGPDRPVSPRGAPRRRRATIVRLLVGLAVLAIVTVAVLWSWMSGAGPPESPTSDATTSAVAADPAVVQSPGPKEVEADQIESAVQSWADAWSRGDVEAYLSFYADTFEPEGGGGRAGWEAQRRERLAGHENIGVTLTDLISEPIDASHARVTFSQTYRSDSYFDVVRKRLELVRQPEGWRIERELVE